MSVELSIFFCLFPFKEVRRNEFIYFNVESRLLDAHVRSNEFNSCVYDSYIFIQDHCFSFPSKFYAASECKAYEKQTNVRVILFVCVHAETFVAIVIAVHADGYLK